MLSFLCDAVFSWLIPILLFAAGAFLIWKTGFLSVLRPKCVRAALQKQAGGQSPFRALTVALAGTLGVGNIVGVTSAVAVGGAGAVFWMLLSACLAMSVKYGETVLAVRYRTEKDGRLHGGAMYYIAHGLHKKQLAKVFCLLCVAASFLIGNLVQTNAVLQAVDYAFSIPKSITAVAFALLIFLVIMGGAKRIADVTSRLIPWLTSLYLVASFAILLQNASQIPSVVCEIFRQAFSLRPVIGGAFGFSMLQAVRFGVARGLMSNEAGCGTAPIAHAGANTDSAGKQGIWGIFEVGIDTVLLCTVTALVILLAPAHLVKGTDAMQIALSAYGSFFGDWMAKGLALAIVCFAFATVVGWSYYATECIDFLSKRKFARTVYLIAYTAVCALSFLFGEGQLLEATDFFVYLLTLINTLCVLRLWRDIREETQLFVKSSGT